MTTPKSPELSITYLYPKSMNIYGDRGNILALTQRCQWRGIKVILKHLEVGEKFVQTQSDLVFAGGGQDRHQLRIAADLEEKKSQLHQAVNRGVVFLLVCGSYQLFGHYFKTAIGQKIPGISVFDAYTIASTKRKIGNVIIKLPSSTCQPSTLVGFENHSGNTYLNVETHLLNVGTRHGVSSDKNAHLQTTQPLGTVIRGFGNNGEDKSEGARLYNCFGTYLHGSLLPKNPHFTDYLIKLALENKYQQKISLKPLDDSLELNAHNFILRQK